MRQIDLCATWVFLHLTESHRQVISVQNCINFSTSQPLKARLLVMRWICWSRWGILKGRSGRFTGSGDPNTPFIHWRSQLQATNTSRSSENMWKQNFLGVFKRRKPKTKRFGEDTNFTKLLIQPKRFTPLMSPMRLGEKTGMGRALGMPRRICGMDWLWRAASNPETPRLYAIATSHVMAKVPWKRTCVGGQWPKVDMRSKKNMTDWWLGAERWEMELFETKFLA